MQNKNLTLPEIFNSKAFVQGSLSFQSPSAYISPVIDIFNKYDHTDLIVQTSNVIENKNEDGSPNISYGRVNVQAKIKFNEEFEKTIGFVYALDTMKPVLKVYSGLTVKACTNLCVFNPEQVDQVSILDINYKKLYTTIDNFCNNIETMADRYLEIVDTLKSTQYNHTEVHALIGKFLEQGLKSQALGTGIAMSTAKALYEPTSRYFINGEKTTGWNIYNAATQYITDKVDILDKSSKTLFLNSILVN